MIIRDEVAQQIIDSLMVPSFKENKYYEGLDKASKEIARKIYEQPELVGKKNGSL